MCADRRRRRRRYERQFALNAMFSYFYLVLVDVNADVLILMRRGVRQTNLN